MSDFRLISNDFTEGATLPLAYVYAGFGHHGGNISPHLAWDGVPEGTKSFVVSLYDPDAPTGSGFWHWVVVDIPGDVRRLKANAAVDGLPEGSRQTRNDMGSRDYIGAAPPPGPSHRYVFTVHALSVDKLPVPDDASGALVGFIAGMNTLGKATLTVKYGA
jgi:Raf kinase inhibitor-like YbhB/YbcL family protein